MIGYIENPQIISSSKHDSKPYGKIQNRATHGFIFKIQGSAEYLFNGKIVHLNEREMIFLPRGSSYEYTTHGNNGNLYTSINFLADIESPSVSVYPMENFYRLNFICQSFSELWRFGSLSDKYTNMSVFYDLLSYISNAEHVNEANENKYSLIEPAMDYMREHIYDCSFRIDKLHLRCGISDTYFRRIFKSRFGLTPKEYVISERISHARSIIESRDYVSISEIAATVGYSDPLYFSKAFKRVFGVCPTGISD
jgi:AraC-like DNA-binding protein